MTTLAAIAKAMKERDAIEAPGSETREWGVFCDAAKDEWGVLPYDEDNNEIEVSDDFAAYWMAIADDDLETAALHGDTEWVEDEEVYFYVSRIWDDDVGSEWPHDLPPEKCESIGEAHGVAKEFIDDHVNEGDYYQGDADVTVSISYGIEDQNGNQVDVRTYCAPLELDEEWRIQKAGGDPDCWHEWSGQSESLGGTTIQTRERCDNCGMSRCTLSFGSQRNCCDQDKVWYEMPEMVAAQAPKKLIDSLPCDLDIDKCEMFRFEDLPGEVDGDADELKDCTFVVVAPYWTVADTGDAVEYTNGETRDEVVADFVSDLEAGTKTSWASFATYRAGYAIDYSGDLAHLNVDREDHKNTIAPDEPECHNAGGHDWQAPYSLFGGLKENPGVWGHGGGEIMHEACALCGIYRTTDTWAQDPEDGEQGLTSVRYDATNEDSEQWVYRHALMAARADEQDVDAWDRAVAVFHKIGEHEEIGIEYDGIDNDIPAPENVAGRIEEIRELMHEAPR